jgi:hypothetical protein
MAYTTYLLCVCANLVALKRCVFCHIPLTTTHGEVVLPTITAQRGGLRVTDAWGEPRTQVLQPYDQAGSHQYKVGSHEGRRP